MGLEIRTLRYFLAVAREGSITKAASTLYMSQPALSQQIKALEAEVGSDLFERRSHSVVLTEKGRLLRQRAEEILALVDRTEGELSPASDVVMGDVHIGLGESWTSSFVARAAHSVIDRYPGVRFHLHDGNTDDLIDHLDSGLLDFCVLLHPEGISKYNSIEVPERDSWGVLMRRDNPLARNETICAQDLVSSNEPLMFSEQAITQLYSENVFPNWFGEEYEFLNVVGTYNLSYNATLFAAEGVCSVICIERQVRVDEEPMLCFRPLSPSLEVESSVVWKRERVLSPAAMVFLEAVRAELGAERQ